MGHVLSVGGNPWALSTLPAHRQDTEVTAMTRTMISDAFPRRRVLALAVVEAAAGHLHS